MEYHAPRWIRLHDYRGKICEWNTVFNIWYTCIDCYIYDICMNEWFWNAIIPIYELWIIANDMRYWNVTVKCVWDILTWKKWWYWNDLLIVHDYALSHMFSKWKVNDSPPGYYIRIIDLWRSSYEVLGSVPRQKPGGPTGYWAAPHLDWTHNGLG